MLLKNAFKLQKNIVVEQSKSKLLNKMVVFIEIVREAQNFRFFTVKTVKKNVKVALQPIQTH